MDNFYKLQQLAFLAYMMNGDAFAVLPMRHNVGQPYDLRVQLIEADRVCSPDLDDRLFPCIVNDRVVDSIVQGIETDEAEWFLPTGFATSIRFRAWRQCRSR